MKNIIFYEDWQYNCCGPDIVVGEYIWWQVTPFTKEILIKNGNKTKKIVSNLLCENCSGESDRMLSAKITKIEVLYYNNNNQIYESKSYKSTLDYKNAENDTFSGLLIYVDNIEEYLFKDYKNLSIYSNPYLNNNKSNKEKYEKIVIFDSSKDLGLNISKYFKEKHFHITWYNYDNKKIDNLKNKLKDIRNYSICEIYNLVSDKIKWSLEELQNSLIIIISDKYDNTELYNQLLNELESSYHKSNLCHIKMENKKYEVIINHVSTPSNILEAKKYLKNLSNEIKEKLLDNWQTLDILYESKIQFKNEKTLLNFLSKINDKKIKLPNYKILLLLFSILWIIIIKY